MDHVHVFLLNVNFGINVNVIYDFIDIVIYDEGIGMVKVYFINLNVNFTFGNSIFNIMDDFKVKIVFYLKEIQISLKDFYKSIY